MTNSGRIEIEIDPILFKITYVNSLKDFLEESFKLIIFLLLTDLDAVFNGLYGSLYVKLQVQITELIFIEKNHVN